MWADSSADLGGRMDVRVEVRSVRFSTARRLRTFVRGGISGLRGCCRSVGGMRISLGMMGPRATRGGRTKIGILIPGKRFCTDGVYSAFRRTVSIDIRTLKGRLIGCGRGRHDGWGIHGDFTKGGWVAGFTTISLTLRHSNYVF